MSKATGKTTTARLSAGASIAHFRSRQTKPKARSSLPPIPDTVAEIAKAWLANAALPPETEDSDEPSSVWVALDRALISTPVVSLDDARGLIQVALSDFETQHSDHRGVVQPGDDEHRILWAALKAADKWLASPACDEGRGRDNPDRNKRIASAAFSLESRMYDLRWAATLMQSAVLETDHNISDMDEAQLRAANTASFAVYQVADRVEGLFAAFGAALDGVADTAYDKSAAKLGGAHVDTGRPAEAA